MSSSGFYRSFRSQFDHPILKNNIVMQGAWNWIIGNAKFLPTRTEHKGSVIVLERGQVLGGRDYLAKEWGITVDKVRTILLKLKKNGMVKIHQAPNHGANVITVCNYDKFQWSAEEDPQAQPQAGPRLSPGSPHNINKEKNIEEVLVADLTDQERSEFDAIISRLHQVGGKALNRTRAGLETLTDVNIWIEAGADFEKDILPTIKKLSSKARPNAIASWGYFTAAVAEARDRRLRTEAKMRTSPKTQVLRQPEPLGYEVFEPEPIPVARAGDFWGDHAEH